MWVIPPGWGTICDGVTCYIRKCTIYYPWLWLLINVVVISNLKNNCECALIIKDNRWYIYRRNNWHCHKSCPNLVESPMSYFQILAYKLPGSIFMIGAWRSAWIKMRHKSRKEIVVLTVRYRWTGRQTRSKRHIWRRWAIDWQGSPWCPSTWWLHLRAKSVQTTHI